MTDREMDALIAERVCGATVCRTFRQVGETAGAGRLWVVRLSEWRDDPPWPADALLCGRRSKPWSPSTDLNAMAEAEAMLTVQARLRYLRALGAEVMRGVMYTDGMRAEFEREDNMRDWLLATATAQQRARAMVKVIGGGE